MRIPPEARKYLAALGRKGGRSRSKAKIQAARWNGRKGGRPAGEVSKLAKRLGISRQAAYQRIKRERLEEK